LADVHDLFRIGFGDEADFANKSKESFFDHLTNKLDIPRKRGLIWAFFKKSSEEFVDFLRCRVGFLFELACEICKCFVVNFPETIPA
jgi:hypothetical protein